MQELLPCRTAVNNDEEGVPCSSKEAQQQWWRRHFTKVFNRLRSQFEEKVLESVRQREVNGSIAGKPTAREAKKALGNLKNGKAAGFNFQHLARDAQGWC